MLPSLSHVSWPGLSGKQKVSYLPNFTRLFRSIQSMGEAKGDLHYWPLCFGFICMHLICHPPVCLSRCARGRETCCCVTATVMEPSTLSVSASQRPLKGSSSVENVAQVSVASRDCNQPENKTCGPSSTLVFSCRHPPLFCLQDVG